MQLIISLVASHILKERSDREIEHYFSFKSPEQISHLVVVTSIAVFSIFIMRGLLKLAIFNIRDNKTLAYFFNFIFYTVDLIYWGYCVMSLYGFMKIPRSSIYEHTLNVLIVSFFCFISISFMFRTTLFIAFVCISIPVYVNSIIENPRLFFKENGISEVSKQTKV